MSRNPLHIPALTGVRAFAALWVVLLHFRANVGVHDIINFDWIAARGYWGVDFFFVLSGFILTHTYFESLRQNTTWSAYRLFLVKRIARIYPLHIFSLLIFAGLLYLGEIVGAHYVSAERCTLLTLIPNLLLIQGWGVSDSLSWNYPSWSISAEWFAYLAVFALFVYGLSRKKEEVGLRLVGYSWLGLCLYTSLTGGSVDSFTAFALPRVFVEFLGGCVLYRMAKRGFGKTLPRWSLIAGVGGILTLSQLSVNLQFLLLPLIGLVILTLYHGGNYGAQVFSNPVTVYLGEISYSIYLLHPLGQIIGDALLKNSSHFYTISESWLILASSLLGVGALSALGYHLVESPARRRIIGLYLRRRAKLRSIPSLRSRSDIPNVS